MTPGDWIATFLALWSAVIGTLAYIDQRKESKKTAQRKPNKPKRKR